LPDLTGRLGLIGLIELLQLIELGGHDARLEVTIEGQREGEVRLKGGEVVQAHHQHLGGTEAMLSLLRLRAGGFALYITHEAQTEAGSEGPRIGSLLLEFLRLEDELARFADTQLAPEQPLLLTREPPEQNPVGEGLGEILRAIREKPGITQARLQATLSLTPQRVTLAVAWLHSLGRLELCARPRASAKIALISADWLVQLTGWRQGKLRLLVACPAGVSAKDLGECVAALRGVLKAGPASFEPTLTGPSFVRLRPAVGGVLSLTFLPISRKHRFLFQTFAQGVDLVLVPENLDPLDRAELLPDFSPDHLLYFSLPTCPAGLLDALRGFARRHLSPLPTR
jgi:hypothetical protein